MVETASADPTPLPDLSYPSFCPQTLLPTIFPLTLLQLAQPSLTSWMQQWQAGTDPWPNAVAS